MLPNAACMYDRQCISKVADRPTFPGLAGMVQHVSAMAGAALVYQGIPGQPNKRTWQRSIEPAAIALRGLIAFSIPLTTAMLTSAR